MKKLLYFIICMPLWWLTACNVHEWPDAPEYVKFHLRLNYETDMTVWNQLYDDISVTDAGYGETYNNQQTHGQIRYIVRAFPLSQQKTMTSEYRHEFVFTKNIADGYDHEVTLDLLPGDYNIMVWSDLVKSAKDVPFYDAANFAEIRLQGEHQPNTDYRDAFRGTNRISLVADIMERLPDTLDITMQRPLAKFELITNDVVEFIDKEVTRVASKGNGGKAPAGDDAPSRVINLEDYKVMFYYVGFMPDAYSMYTDKPVDSSTGVFFESSLKQLSESEASLGFDYVMVNGKKSVVTVKIGIFDNEGLQLSMSEPIEVPLQRNYHTVIRGMFLMSEASGGVSINPEFDGDYNLIFP